MSNELKSRFPHLGNLSIALLEHLTKPIVGEEAQKVLKEPTVQKKQQEELAKIVEQTEKEFLHSHQDEELKQGLVSLAPLPSVQSAVQEFYNRPTSSQLRSVLIQILSETLPEKVQAERIEAAIDHYLDILQRELVVSSLEEMRGKLDSLALQGIETNTTQILEVLLDIRRLLVTCLPIASTENSQIQNSLFSLRNSVQRTETPQTSEILVEIGRIVTNRGEFMNQYDKLRNWLNRLTDTEFRDLIRILLTVEEQTYLPRSVEIIGRGDFLGHMQQLRRLPIVEKALVDRYPERLSD